MTFLLAERPESVRKDRPAAYAIGVQGPGWNNWRATQIEPAVFDLLKDGLELEYTGRRHRFLPEEAASDRQWDVWKVIG